MEDKNEFLLALDVSTTTIGVCLMSKTCEVKELTSVTPIIKPKPSVKIDELSKKADVFEKKLLEYKDLNIVEVYIEEPLLRSNNVYTVGTLLKFNGMISKKVIDVLGIIPEEISSYDARAGAFPELLQKRRVNKKGEPLDEKKIAKGKPVLFGAYEFDVDKKHIIWEKVAKLEPQVKWTVNGKGQLRKENYDASDAYTVCLAKMREKKYWTRD